IQNAIDGAVDGVMDAWNETVNFFHGGKNKQQQGDSSIPMAAPSGNHRSSPGPFASPDSYYGESQAKCFDGSSEWRNDGGSYAHNLNVNNLMPASWRNTQPCTALNDTDTTEWAAYAPSKQAFDN